MLDLRAAVVDRRAVQTCCIAPMNWLAPLLTNHVAYGMLVLCAVAALGLTLGSLKIRGLGLGIAGTLFVGILFGHFGLNIDPDVRNFLQEFGLIIFVYTIGMQVGPSFLTTLRRRGLPLNLLAAAVVLVGAATTVALCLWLEDRPRRRGRHLLGRHDEHAVAGRRPAGPQEHRRPGEPRRGARPGLCGLLSVRHPRHHHRDADRARSRRGSPCRPSWRRSARSSARAGARWRP